MNEQNEAGFTEGEGGVLLTGFCRVSVAENSGTVGIPQILTAAQSSLAEPNDGGL